MDSKICQPNGVQMCLSQGLAKGIGGTIGSMGNDACTQPFGTSVRERVQEDPLFS